MFAVLTGFSHTTTSTSSIRHITFNVENQKTRTTIEQTSFPKETETKHTKKQKTAHPTRHVTEHFSIDPVMKEALCVPESEAGNVIIENGQSIWEDGMEMNINASDTTLGATGKAIDILMDLNNQTGRESPLKNVDIKGTYD